MNATIAGRGRAVGVAIVLALSLAIPAISAAPASADAPSPVGRYRLTTTTRKTQLVVNADHTFLIVDFNDGGTWAQVGNVIALGVYSGSDIGCVLVGVVNATGISGKGHPGNFSCGTSTVFPLYAVRLPPKGGGATASPAGGSLRAALGRSARPAATPIDPTGSYTASRSGAPTRFVVASDHNASWPDLGESGTWAELNGLAAFLVISFTTNRGCLSLGRVHATAINSAKQPGPTVCPGAVESTWFARRLPV